MSKMKTYFQALQEATCYGCKASLSYDYVKGIKYLQDEYVHTGKVTVLCEHCEADMLAEMSDEYDALGDLCR
jgi:hypothetical protein